MEGIFFKAFIPFPFENVGEGEIKVFAPDIMRKSRRELGPKHFFT